MMMSSMEVHAAATLDALEIISKQIEEVYQAVHFEDEDQTTIVKRPFENPQRGEGK